MKKILTAALAFTIIGIPQTYAQSSTNWSEADIKQLDEWAEAAHKEAVNICPSLTESPRPSQKGIELDTWANARALSIANGFLNGCSKKRISAHWDIKDDDDSKLSTKLENALTKGTLDSFFSELRPHHPYYQALSRAYRAEKFPAMRKKLALNLERWRWMPQKMGDKFILVNVANYKATLWENGKAIRSWPIIVGKQKTPTPVFSSDISGVIFNPWWEIPTSIVRESVGSLVRNKPAEASRRGYVLQNGRYRQQPGPGNALGQMKLVMPNNYSVYLHDTPNKTLFEEEVRMFSHGCIRVGGALDMAATLISETASPDEVAKIVESKKTTRINMTKKVPVYITYFTAEPDSTGSIVYYADIYGRDTSSVAVVSDEQCYA